MSNILVTAIGSMSASCVITALKEQGHRVVGCDIHPKEWHYLAQFCDNFYQVAPASVRDSFFVDIYNICTQESIDYIMPLIDVEVDLFSHNREWFDNNNIIVCISNIESISIARDKYRLFSYFKHDDNLPSIPTFDCCELDVNTVELPLIAKKRDGRSSIGLEIVNTKERLSQLQKEDNYIFQRLLDGEIFTVDYIRDAKTSNYVAIPRDELVRTSNGAGLTVKILNNSRLVELTNYIGTRLNINGCVNMEFIHNNDDYYLIDINPRFSAGIAFTMQAGYNLPINHLRCFSGESIEDACQYNEFISTKLYREYIVK